MQNYSRKILDVKISGKEKNGEGDTFLYSTVYYLTSSFITYRFFIYFASTAYSLSLMSVRILMIRDANEVGYDCELLTEDFHYKLFFSFCFIDCCRKSS